MFYLIAWGPYAIVSMYSAFINDPPLSPIIATIPALFAKSSIVWPAVCNLILMNKERKKFFETIVEESSKFLQGTAIQSTKTKDSVKFPNEKILNQRCSSLLPLDNSISSSKNLNQKSSQIASKLIAKPVIEQDRESSVV